MKTILLAASAALLTATPALAQDAVPPAPAETALPDPNDQSDSIQVGVGVAFVADYEGADEYRIRPGLQLRARVSGITVFNRGTYLYADVIPGGSNIDFDAGPIVGLRLNRTNKVKDKVVRLLGDRKTAFELGGFAGVSFKGLTNPYDTLSFRMEAVKDVAKAHQSWVLSPTVDFSTPLSRSTFAGVSFSTEFVSRKYADYYFGIDPAGSLASGLPEYSFTDGGLKSWQTGLLLAQSLSGDPRKGWGLFALGSYKRLLGDIADSPIVANRGSRHQWFGVAGVGYSW